MKARERTALRFFGMLTVLLLGLFHLHLLGVSVPVLSSLYHLCAGTHPALESRDPASVQFLLRVICAYTVPTIGKRNALEHLLRESILDASAGGPRRVRLTNEEVDRVRDASSSWFPMDQDGYDVLYDPFPFGMPNVAMVSIMLGRDEKTDRRVDAFGLLWREALNRPDAGAAAKVEALWREVEPAAVRAKMKLCALPKGAVEVGTEMDSSIAVERLIRVRDRLQRVGAGANPTAEELKELTDLSWQ